MFRILILTLILVPLHSAIAQTDTIDNRSIVEMTRAGLSPEIILKKLATSEARFDVSTSSLIGLKKAGVDDNVITAMMERNELNPPIISENASPSTNVVVAETANHFSESGPPPIRTSKAAVSDAKTIAFTKSSLQPARQALEKELMKRKDFQQLDLTILRYKEQADLFVDIGFVSGSLITHRYVYRIYDRRTGAVITAGETTSWGSLAENLARHISKSLTAARSGKVA
jgi:hypothetical protein